MIMRYAALSAVAMTILGFFASVSPVAADESFPGELSGNVALTSEYSFRGIAQSDEHPAFQGGVDWSHDSGFYLGFWGSNVDFNDGDEASVEMDVYGGMTGEVAGLNWDLGLIYYAYPGADSSLDYDFVEAKASLGYDFTVMALTAALNYSPDYFAGSGDSFYYSLGADVPLPHDFSLSAHAGYQDIDDEAAFGVPDYIDWSIGAGYTWENIDMSLAYVDTDLDRNECADGCSERIIFSLKFSF